LTSKNTITLQFLVTETVTQAVNSKSMDPQWQNTDEQNCSIGSVGRWDNQLPLTGGPQMSTISNHAPIHQVRRSSSMKTSVYKHGQLESYSIGDIEPVELVVQYSRQSAIVLPSITDDANSSLSVTCLL